MTTWARFPTASFAFEGDEPVRFASSPGVTRTFCGRCGSSLTYHYPSGERVDVTTSTFDDPTALAPTFDGPGRPAWMDEVLDRD